MENLLKKAGEDVLPGVRTETSENLYLKNMVIS